tara:strand:+ start:617 stop:1327 length:711 start_codon:yes stop_codon:yes gene_type:complete
MAITAGITLTSAAGDLTSNGLALSTSAALTTAGTSTAISQTTGLARKTTTSADQYTIFKADDYTDDKANKIYLKNTETTAGLYFLITIDDEPLGRLYAGDWALIPWSATGGTKAAFTVTFANTWAQNDTMVFDGVTATCGATETPAGMTDVVAALKFPNWTAAETASTVVTFTAKDSNIDFLPEEGAASDQVVVTTAGNGTGTVARTVTAVASANDIKITPSTTASHTLEYMLFYE